MSNNPTDRRKYARLDLKSKVFVSILETDDNNPPNKFEAIGNNIGVEGICFTSDQPLDPGMILDMEIVLPDSDEPISVEGKVMWCNPSPDPEGDCQTYDTGIQFLDIDKNHVKLMVKYVCGELGGKDHHLNL